MTRLFYCFCAAFLLALVVGCGSGNVGLRGTVTFADDGSPVTSGTVGFRKDGRIARGDIQPDGTYVVGFERIADGLPPGRYEVFVTGTERVTVTTLGQDSEGRPIEHYDYEQLIDRRYESPETSPLVVDVDASTKVFDIQVTRFRGR